MDLNQQIQVLIDNAPREGNLAQAVQTIAPVLKLVASQLKHLQYYIVQNLDEAWVMTTLSHRSQSMTTKKVVYAFPNLKEAQASYRHQQDPQLMVLPMPVTHILFQMLALQTQVDSIIFLETTGDRKAGVEIPRADLYRSIQLQLQRSQQAADTADSVSPLDIA